MRTAENNRIHTHSQCIYSVGRRFLNEALLTAGESFPNLHLHFEHKLTDLDLDRAEATFAKGERGARVEEKVEADFVLGCDGAFSNVRRAMAREPYFDFSQEYIPHAYLELCIPPDDKTGDVSVWKNKFHVKIFCFN